MDFILAAGADIIETNTFSGTTTAQHDYKLDKVPPFFLLLLLLLLLLLPFLLLLLFLFPPFLLLLLFLHSFFMISSSSSSPSLGNGFMIARVRLSPQR